MSYGLRLLGVGFLMAVGALAVAQQGVRPARRASTKVPLPAAVLSSIRGITPATTRPKVEKLASFGTRPTVAGTEPLLEEHLFDFDGDIYRRRIGVEFVARLRDEEKFADLEALVAQMHRDAAQARAILSNLPQQAYA